MHESTKRFLQLMKEENEAIARLAAADAERKARKAQPDELRLQREAERREKLGELRARERPSNRPRKAYSVFPYIDLT